VVWPDRRTYDLDNYWKGLLDARTHARVWFDDGQIIRQTATERGILKPGGLRIRVEVIDQETLHDLALCQTITTARK